PPGLEEELPVFSRPALRPLLARTGGDLPQEVLDYALAQYTAEVSYTDHWVGELLATLAATGVDQGTLVVVVADHGECLGKGTYFEHGTCLDQGAVHVPLLLRLPGKARTGVVDGAVELLDLAPTMLEVAGLPVPAAFAGRSLLAPRPDDSVAITEHPLYDPGAVDRREERRDFLVSVAGQPIRDVEAGDLVAVRDGRWKLLVGEGGRARLYDLAEDPDEERDLTTEHPEVVDRLQRHLRAWLARYPTPPDQPSEIDAELEKTLRSLGY
ncbi:MAG: sulfatase-like hydrolase/transferase, partial [Acidobacteria bacterium]|nr:sulfatase-like hydrolase/transferase [Acidobacteriota bacterium]